MTFLSIIGFLGGIVFATGGGLFWMDIVDHFLNHYGLVVVGILECILIGWIFKASKLREYINHICSGFSIGSWWDFSIKFLTPILLMIILFSDLIGDISHPYEGYPWLANILIGRDWLIFTLFAAIIVASRPWKIDIHKQHEE